MFSKGKIINSPTSHDLGNQECHPLFPNYKSPKVHKGWIENVPFVAETLGYYNFQSEYLTVKNSHQDTFFPKLKRCVAKDINFGFSMCQLCSLLITKGWYNTKDIILNIK